MNTQPVSTTAIQTAVSLSTAEAVRAEFPILEQTVRQKPLVYLDNAATTQKPRCVIDAISTYYETTNANVHRAAHYLADQATTQMENARATIAEFLNAADATEVVFTRGTTEAINLVANGLRHRVAPGDEILVSHLEHHANIVPWQMLCEQTGTSLKVVEIDAQGDLDLDDYRSKLNDRTRLVAIGHVSNALGTVNPVGEIVADAHAAGALCLIDGAQATAHIDIDVQAIGCDFYAFSGHKCFGPTGIGALYGTAAALDQLAPWQGGGEMIERVSFSGTTYNRPPFRFEAGTPNIAGAVGLGAALEFLRALPLQALAEAEHKVLQWTLAQLRQMPEIRLVGDPAQRQSVISFLPRSGAADDIGTLLDQQGIATRTGHHCTMPLWERWSLPGGTVRISFSLYNTQAEAEAFVAALKKALTFL